MTFNPASSIAQIKHMCHNAWWIKPRALYLLSKHSTNSPSGALQSILTQDPMSPIYVTL